MLRKVCYILIIAMLAMGSGCSSSYKASKGKRGEQCDCPKSNKVKNRMPRKYR